MTETLNVIALASDFGASAIYTGGAVYDFHHEEWLLPFMTNPKDGAAGPTVHLAHMPSTLGKPSSIEKAIMPGFDPGVAIVAGATIVTAHGGKTDAGGIHYIWRFPGQAWSPVTVLALDGDGQSIENTIGPIGGDIAAVVYVHGNDDYDRRVRVRRVTGAAAPAMAYSEAATTGIGPGGSQVRAMLRRTGVRGHVGCFHMIPDQSGGARKIGMSESTDLGLTWGPPRVIAAAAGVEMTNPFAVHRSDGRLQCFFTHASPKSSGHDLAFVESTDNGATWSPIAVTSDLGCARVVMFEAEDKLVCYTSLGLKGDQQLVTFAVQGPAA